MAESTDTRVLVVLGSPRVQSNSSELAMQVANGARSKGAIIELQHLSRLTIRPCSACDACRENPDAGCIIPDDMQRLYPAVREADVMVIASPVYCFSVSAQVKTFLDRLYALMKEGEDGMEFQFKGKKVAIVLTYGDEDIYKSGGINAMRMYEDLFKFTGVTIAGSVYGTANRPGEIIENAALLEQARELGRSLVQD